MVPVAAVCIFSIAVVAGSEVPDAPIGLKDLTISVFAPQLSGVVIGLDVTILVITAQLVAIGILWGRFSDVEVIVGNTTDTSGEFSTSVVIVTMSATTQKTTTATQEPALPIVHSLEMYFYHHHGHHHHHRGAREMIDGRGP